MSALANYLSDELRARQNAKVAAAWNGNVNSDKFIARLAGYREILRRRRRQEHRAGNGWRSCARTCKDPYFGWAFFEKAMRETAAPDRRAKLAEIASRYVNVPGLEYHAAYQRANALRGSE